MKITLRERFKEDYWRNTKEKSKLSSYRPVGEPGRGCSDLPVLVRAVPHHLGVNGARNTVVQLGIQLRQGKSCTQKIKFSLGLSLFKFFCETWNFKLLTGVDTGLSDVTNSSRFHNVANNKLLDSLVLSHTASTVGATNGTNVSASVLGASVIASLQSLLEKDGISKCRKNVEQEDDGVTWIVK